VRWDATSLRIALGDGTTKAVAALVTADIPGIAIHRDRWGWSVSHLASGLSMLSMLPDRRAAERAALALAGRDWARDARAITADPDTNAFLLRLRDEFARESA